MFHQLGLEDAVIWRLYANKAKLNVIVRTKLKKVTQLSDSSRLLEENWSEKEETDRLGESAPLNPRVR